MSYALCAVGLLGLFVVGDSLMDGRYGTAVAAFPMAVGMICGAIASRW